MKKIQIFILLIISVVWQSLSVLAAERKAGVLILTHVKTEVNTVIPEGSEVQCILIDGTRISGPIGSFTENGFKVGGEDLRLAEIETIVYKDPSRDKIRQLGDIGIVGGGILSLASAIYSGVLLSQNYLDGLLFLFITVFLFPAFLLGLGLAILGHTPRRHDRYKLRKWYKARMGELGGQDS